MTIGDSIKGVLSDAEKAGRTGARALIINHPFAATLIALVLGALLGHFI